MSNWNWDKICAWSFWIFASIAVVIGTATIILGVWIHYETLDIIKEYEKLIAKYPR